MPDGKLARGRPSPPNTVSDIPSGSPRSGRRPCRDITTVIVIGLVLLETASWLVDQSLFYIYLGRGIGAAALAYLISAPWLRHGLIAITAVLLSLMAGELYLDAIENNGSAGQRRSDQHATLRYSKPLRSNGGPLGYAPLPDRVVEARKSVGSERIYDVTYSIDDHGLRITPGVKASTAPRGAFLFFGCSFTFGEGLNDDETLPYDFARELGFAYPVVNLGFSGYGPHQMLKRIESGMLDAVVSGPVRAAVYVALPSHVDRAAGRAWWDPVGPKYLLDSQGIARYAGPFMSVPEPLVPMFYQLLQRIETGPSLLAGRVVDLVLSARADDLPLRIRTFTGIVARAAQLLKERYRAKLSILYWDDRSALSEAILTSLAASNFQTIKVSEIIPLGRREAYQIPKDWHPTAAANELLAKELSKRILTDGAEAVAGDDQAALARGW